MRQPDADTNGRNLRLVLVADLGSRWRETSPPRWCEGLVGVRRRVDLIVQVCAGEASVAVQLIQCRGDVVEGSGNALGDDFLSVSEFLGEGLHRA
jgi:hypothetical protein